MVKKLVSVLCICAYFGLAHAQIPQEIWKESEQIEKQIKKTSFPDRVYNINEGGNLAASKIRNLECPSYEICLIDYGCGKFNRKIHIMEQYP